MDKTRSIVLSMFFVLIMLYPVVSRLHKMSMVGNHRHAKAQLVQLTISEDEELPLIEVSLYHITILARGTSSY